MTHDQCMEMMVTSKVRMTMVWEAMTILARYLLVPSFTITTLPSLVFLSSLLICLTFTRLINPLSFDSSHSIAISFHLRDISLLKTTRIASIRFHANINLVEHVTLIRTLQ